MRPLVVALLLLGCHKNSAPPNPGEPVSTKDVDALWALAPDGMQVGVVISPRGLAMVEHAALDVRAFLAGAPDLGVVADKLERELTKLTGSANPRLADAGLTADKGAAVFAVGPDDSIGIVPLADRDKFLAIVHGTKGTDVDHVGRAVCKTVNNVYACASSEALFARLGRGHVPGQLTAIKARGDIEMVMSGPSLGSVSVGVVGQLARGAVVVRGVATGVPSTILANLGKPATPRVDRGRSAGFISVDLTPAMQQIPPGVLGQPLIEGVTFGDLAHAFAGQLTVDLGAGELALDARAPLTDATPVKTVVEHCTDLPGLGKLVTIADGKCRVAVPNTPFVFDVWVDGKELRLGTKGGAKGQEVALTALGDELASHDWSFAFWGRGTMVGLGAMPGMPAVLPPEAMTAMRVATTLDELGIGLKVDGDALQFVAGIRTMWSNPDDVVAKLVAIAPADVLQARGREVAKSIADAAPGAPFADDFKSGYAGLAFPVGLLAAVAIPAFMDYMKKSKTSEAQLQLNRLAKSLRAQYATDGKFPVGHVDLTPAEPCCQQPGGKCTGDWTAPAWQKLEFEIDRPHLYQYAYDSDGKTATAIAVGDLDCDGTAITYALHAEAAGGQTTITIAEPPPNSD